VQHCPRASPRWAPTVKQPGSYPCRFVSGSLFIHSKFRMREWLLGVTEEGDPPTPLLYTEGPASRFPNRLAIGRDFGQHPRRCIIVRSSTVRRLGRLATQCAVPPSHRPIGRVARSYSLCTGPIYVATPQSPSLPHPPPPHARRSRAPPQTGVQYSRLHFLASCHSGLPFPAQWRERLRRVLLTEQIPRCPSLPPSPAPQPTVRRPHRRLAASAGPGGQTPSLR